MDPAAALREIAFQLERAGAPTYRVRAFRRAAGAVTDLPPGELGRRLGEGTLAKIAGIGAVTAEVIAQAAAGQQPDYLTRLLAEAPAQAGPATATATTPGLRAALRGDCHTHSDWSDGGSPVAEMAEAARRLGHEWIALTDHSPRLTVARGLSAERLEAQLELVRALNAELGPFRILSGIEVDILPDGALDQRADLLAELDVVVASVHSQLRMAAGPMTERMLAAVANPHVDVLGHCTGRLITGRGRPESAFDAAAVFASCRDHGVAVEINCRPERQDPPDPLLALAAQAGCLFAIDTDAHAPGQLDWQGSGCARAEQYGITADRVINARTADDVTSGRRKSPPPRRGPGPGSQETKTGTETGAGTGAGAEIPAASGLITHPDKVLFAERGETKGDLAAHYLRVAGPLMRVMGGLPVLLQRFPEGADGPSFFQKRVPKNFPAWLQTTIVATPNGTRSQALVAADIDHVLWAVNLGCLGFHVWPYRADNPAHADELRIDLDPSPGVEFGHIREAARELERLLAAAGITGYLKTTGNRGLHVYVRLQPRWDSYQVRAAAVAVARELERRRPDLITAAWWKEERGGRVFVDFNQNAPHKTVFGAWSVRARPGAQVSTPVAWAELGDIHPDQFTIASLPARLAAAGDPWAAMYDEPQSLEPLLAMSARDRADGLMDAPWPPVYPKQPDEPPRVAPSRAKKT